MKRVAFILSVTLPFAAAAALAVIGKAAAADQVLRWSSAGDVLTFDSHAASDSFSQNVSSEIYETLVRRGTDADLQDRAAVGQRFIAFDCVAPALRGQAYRNHHAIRCGEPSRRHQALRRR